MRPSRFGLGHLVCSYFRTGPKRLLPELLPEGDNGFLDRRVLLETALTDLRAALGRTEDFEHRERAYVALLDSPIEERRLVFAGRIAKRDRDFELGARVSEDVGLAEEVRGARGGSGPSARGVHVVEQVGTVRACLGSECVEAAIGRAATLERGVDQDEDRRGGDLLVAK